MMHCWCKSQEIRIWVRKRKEKKKDIKKGN